MTHHSDIIKVLSDTSFNQCSYSSLNNYGWSNRHPQENECSVSDHLKGYNHHHSIEKHAHLQRSTTLRKCLHSIFFNELNNILSLIFSYHYIYRFWVDWVGIFKRTNEWCVPFMPTSGDLWWWWHQSCSEETTKMSNPVNYNCNTYYAKITFFSCAHTKKLLNGFLLKA